MLRAVCFDLWDTLIVDTPGGGQTRAAERVRRIAEGLRLGNWGAPPEAITDAIQLTIDTLVRVHQDNRDLDADERLALFFRALDPSLRPERDLPLEARRAVATAVHDGALHTPPVLIPGAAGMLEALRACGLRLAIVSNTILSPGRSMRALLNLVGIGRFFTAQIYSDEVRAWKPAARMFDEAVFALGVPAQDTLFVGDTPESDIVGAQAFGMGMTALVGGAALPGVRADLKLADVTGLMPALIRGRLLDAGG